MARPLILPHQPTHAGPSLRAPETLPKATGARARLRGNRSRVFVESLARLDAGTLHDSGAIIRLIDAIRAELGDAGLSDMPLGILARCHLGAPYEVHTLDVEGAIIQHFRSGEALPPGFERARPLALHGAYAFVEVYADTLRCVRPDGTAAPA